MKKHRREAPQGRAGRSRTGWSWLTAVGMALASPAAWPAASPAPTAALVATPADLDAKATEVVQRLVLDRAASLARAQRKADEREQDLLEQLERKDRQLRRSLAAAQAGSTQMAQLRTELAGVTAERERLVAELTSRDRAFQAELAEYRRLVAELANSPNPERRAALERYADGDRSGAFATLKELTRIEEAAGEKAVKLRAAARHREQAALAADMKDRADPGVTTLTVLEEWEAAAERDPGHFETWIYLTRLRQEAGRTLSALESAQRARTVATADRERAAAAADLGDIHQAAGDLAGARASYAESLQIARRLAADNPSSAQARRDVSVSLNNLGDVQQAAGDLAGARASYAECHQILQRLAADDPSSAQAQRDVSVSLNKLGDVQQAAGDLAGARTSYAESHQIRKRLAADNPSSAAARRDVSISLNNLGDVQQAAGDLAGARASYAESLQIARRLATDNPNSAQARRDVSVSLNKLGDVQQATHDLAGARASYVECHKILLRLAADNPSSAQARRDVSVSLTKLGDVQQAAGDLAGARASYAESLQITRRLAADNPNSALARRDVLVSMVKLARMPGSGVRWKEAYQAIQAMKDDGVLAPSDERFLVKLKQLADSEQ